MRILLWVFGLKILVCAKQQKWIKSSIHLKKNKLRTERLNPSARNLKQSKTQIFIYSTINFSV